MIEESNEFVVDTNYREYRNLKCNGNLSKNDYPLYIVSGVGGNLENKITYNNDKDSWFSIVRKNNFLQDSESKAAAFAEDFVTLVKENDDIMNKIGTYYGKEEIRLRCLSYGCFLAMYSLNRFDDKIIKKISRITLESPCSRRNLNSSRIPDMKPFVEKCREAGKFPHIHISCSSKDKITGIDETKETVQELRKAGYPINKISLEIHNDMWHGNRDYIKNSNDAICRIENLENNQTNMNYEQKKQTLSINDMYGSRDLYDFKELCTEFVKNVFPDNKITINKPKKVRTHQLDYLPRGFDVKKETTFETTFETNPNNLNYSTNANKTNKFSIINFSDEESEEVVRESNAQISNTNENKNLSRLRISKRRSNIKKNLFKFDDEEPEEVVKPKRKNLFIFSDEEPEEVVGGRIFESKIENHLSQMDCKIKNP